jgi:transcriptional antiterminator RfaH
MFEVLDAESDSLEAYEEPNEESRWICVRALPKKEFLAVQNLKIQSYRPFLPIVSKTIRHARKTTTVKAPLFPGYLFVRMNLSVEQWRPITGTLGVSQLIMQDGRPKPVPRGVVESLLQAMDEHGCTDFRQKVSVGDEVRLLSGPFFNFVGRLERMGPRGRVAVLLDVLGGQRLVQADKAALQPVV